MGLSSGGGGRLHNILYSFYPHQECVSKYHLIQRRIARDLNDRYHEMVKDVVEFYRSSVGNMVEANHDGPKPAILKDVTIEATVEIQVGGAKYTTTLPLEQVQLHPQTPKTEQIILDKSRRRTVTAAILSGDAQRKLSKSQQ